MKCWYVTYTDGFSMGMSPNDPEDCDIVMAFLSRDSAEKWVQDNNAETWARIMPCTVLEGHDGHAAPVYAAPPYNLVPAPSSVSAMTLH